LKFRETRNARRLLNDNHLIEENGFVKQTRFGGVFVATVTPFGKGGLVNGRALATLVSGMFDQGLDGVCPAGTTGEFPLLTASEKEAVCTTACRNAPVGGKVIAGTWGATRAERVRLARRAEKSGASAVFLTTPYFFASTPEYLLDWYRGVKRAVRIPVFAYNIPQCTANEIPLRVLDTLAGEGTIAGYKDSSPSLPRLKSVIKLLKGRVAVFAGHESHFHLARHLGADGFISGLANAYPRTVRGVWDGDPRAARRLAAIHQVVGGCGYIPSVKFILRQRGLPIGEAREPVSTLSATARGDLRRLERMYGPEL
jgi:dihydrodipicolinate synthase/N-acetylneuraminate lyase